LTSFSADCSLSNSQREHALAIEQLVPEFVTLRMKLCTYMNVEKFWMIYFLLILPRLNQHDFERLSTPKVSHVYLIFFYFPMIHTNSKAKCVLNSFDVYAVINFLKPPYLCEFYSCMLVRFNHCSMHTCLLYFPLSAVIVT
jgi:hypothetical protein